MQNLSDMIKDFERFEQGHDFEGMAKCLSELRYFVYNEDIRSEAGKLFLDKFFNVFVFASFKALEQGAGERALQYLEIAGEVVDKIYGKKNRMLLCYQGFAQQMLGNYEKAEDLYLAYLAGAPDDETIFLRLGNMAAHRQQWDKALEAYGHAMRLKKNYFEAMMNIGIVAKILGDEETAKTMAVNDELYRRIFAEVTLEEDPGRYSLEIEDEEYLQIPIFINARDRLNCLRKQVEWLLSAGYRNIYILDNDSTYKPLLEYYKSIEKQVKILYLKRNLGYKAIWKSGILNILDIRTPYVYTDPDIIPVEACPAGFLQNMLKVLRKNPYIKKVGFGLKTDDITFDGREKVLQLEHEWMKTEVAKDLYFGAIDTTFALYRNYRHYNAYASLRMSGNCMARHLPWYMTYNQLSEDEIYYAQHATNDYSTLKVLKEDGMIKEKSLTSIIIISYNGLEYTRLCLESIRRHTTQGNYEIIVIDNASTDGSAEYLQKQKDIRLILNSENVGFPKGCNQGMQAAQGTDLLLLNNDTIVTPRWLENLRTALYSNSNIGAVSCMTNFAASDQSISLSYNSLSELEKAAGDFNKSNPSKWYPWLILVGFCLLLKRDVYERIGGLDEAFSPGNFEDDDYSLRMRKAGYELLLCGDTYIHHFGGKAFFGEEDQPQRKLKEKQYDEIFAKNYTYIIKKYRLSKDYHSLNEMTELLLSEIGDAKDVLLVNCDLGHDLFWLRRKNRELRLYGLTDNALGMQVAGHTFTVYSCTDFREGIEAHFPAKRFARIALLGNSRELPGGEKLIHYLRRYLTNDGLLYFGDRDHIYRMPCS